MALRAACSAIKNKITHTAIELMIGRRCVICALRNRAALIQEQCSFCKSAVLVGGQDLCNRGVMELRYSQQFSIHVLTRPISKQHPPKHSFVELSTSIHPLDSKPLILRPIPDSATLGSKHATKTININSDIACGEMGQDLPRR